MRKNRNTNSGMYELNSRRVKKIYMAVTASMNSIMNMSEAIRKIEANQTETYKYSNLDTNRTMFRK
jgi:hypothetical protein